MPRIYGGKIPKVIRRILMALVRVSIYRTGKIKKRRRTGTLVGRIAFRKKRRHGNGGLAEREKRNKYKIAAK